MLDREDNHSGAAAAVLACALAALIAGCDLTQAEVVNRGPALGSTVPGNSDAAGTDENSPPADAAVAHDEALAGHDAPGGTRDADSPNDGPGSSRDARPDTTSSRSDAPCSREAGCGTTALLLDDDFEDGIDGWMSFGIIWAASADDSTSEPNEVASPIGQGTTSAYYAAGAWQDMTVEVRVRVVSFGPSSSLNRAEIYARYQDAGHTYGLALRADGTLALRRNSSSWGVPVKVDVTEGEWHRLKLQVSGPRDRVAVVGYLDDILLTAAVDTDSSLPSDVGTVGLGIYGETAAVFDDVLVSSP